MPRWRICAVSILSIDNSGILPPGFLTLNIRLNDNVVILVRSPVLIKRHNAITLFGGVFFAEHFGGFALYLIPERCAADLTETVSF